MERVRITPYELTLKDAAGNIKFTTSRKYIKTDAAGNLAMTTLAPCPVPLFGSLSMRNIGYHPYRNIAFATPTGTGSAQFSVNQSGSLVIVPSLIGNTPGYMFSPSNPVQYSSPNPVAFDVYVNFVYRLSMRWMYYVDSYGAYYYYSTADTGPNLTPAIIAVSSGNIVQLQQPRPYDISGASSSTAGYQTIGFNSGSRSLPLMVTA